MILLLRLVNIILLVFTLGLATPWVMVRNARYRINSTTVLAEDLDSFVEAGRKDFARGRIG